MPNSVGEVYGIISTYLAGHTSRVEMKCRVSFKCYNKLAPYSGHGIFRRIVPLVRYYRPTRGTILHTKYEIVCLVSI